MINPWIRRQIDDIQIDTDRARQKIGLWTDTQMTDTKTHRQIHRQMFVHRQTNDRQMQRQTDM